MDSSASLYVHGDGNRSLPTEKESAYHFRKKPPLKIYVQAMSEDALIFLPYINSNMCVIKEMPLWSFNLDKCDLC
jgi:hypothetical protein